MDVVQLSDLFGPASFHVVDLVLDQRVEFLFLSVPSDCIFPQFPSQLFFIMFQKVNLNVAFTDLVFFDLQVLLEFLDDLLVFLNLSL